MPTVHLTPHDLRYGDPARPDSHPLALAIRRALLPCGCLVAVAGGRVMVRMGEDRYLVRMPLSAWQAALLMKPFKCEAELVPSDGAGWPEFPGTVVAGARFD